MEAGPGFDDPAVTASIADGLRLPIGNASSVARRYRTRLTDEPRRTAEIMRGQVVGGSGAVNGGYFCRGSSTDFDSWGIPGWAWSDVLPHYRAVETDLDFRGPLHGTEGPMLIRRVRQLEHGTRAFVDAALRLGYAWRDDLNGADGASPGIGPVPLNIDGGTRVGPGDAFLRPALHRGNLTILPRTRVLRIRLAGGRAIGVECTGPDGHRFVPADRIVLSAGAIGSAHLLMSSGVGPTRTLEAVGVPVVADLPVGERCADHPEWVLPVDWPSAPGRPPLEAVLTTPDGLELRAYTSGFGAMIGGDDDPADRPHIGVTLMRPRSRGRITLASRDPDVPVTIEHRYDSEPSDAVLLASGAELAHDLAGTGYAARQAHWSTSQHLAGTAPMGVGDEGVLDAQCRVRGVEALWVVDGSIMPSITSRGPHATIVMIGHRAAEFIAR